MIPATALNAAIPDMKIVAYMITLHQCNKLLVEFNYLCRFYCTPKNKDFTFRNYDILEIYVIAVSTFCCIVNVDK